MKKALIVLLILAVAGGLFAQSAPSFSLGGRVDTWFVPFQSVNRDGDTLSGAGLGRDNGGGVGTRARLFGEVAGETVGLRIQLQFFPFAGTGGTPLVGFDDNVEVWWKPTDWFKLDAGKFVQTPLRGKIGDHWMDGFTVGMKGVNDIFSGFDSAGVNNGGAGNLGVLTSFTFGDLFIGAMIPNLRPFGSGATPSNPGGVYETVNYANGISEISDVYERTQFGVGYTIQDVGLVRVQYVGATKSATVAPRVELAFALTGIEGLVLDIGGKFPLSVAADSIKFWDSTDLKWDTPTSDAKYQLNYRVALGVTYALNDKINLNGRVDAGFGGSYDSGISGIEPVKYAPEVNFHIWPTYNLGIVTLGLDFGIEWFGETTQDGKVLEIATVKQDGGTRVGGGLYVQKGIGGATIRGGVAYRAAGERNGVKEDGVFTVPITLEFSF
jgi:hypothetical protein